MPSLRGASRPRRLRPADPAAEGARDPRAARQRARRRLPRRRHQRRPGADGGRRRHLGRHGGRRRRGNPPTSSCWKRACWCCNDGVREGRRVFGNVTKYLRMAGSSNFGNMFSMVGASALLPFLPMAPVQILVNNLLYDVSQTALADRPRRRRVPREAAALGRQRHRPLHGVHRPASSLFDYVTFGVLAWAIRRASPIARCSRPAGSSSRCCRRR